MLAADFMAAFQQAASVPVTKPVVWPEGISVDHPVRALGLTTRYWPLPVSLHLQALADEGAKGWIGRTFWYVIAATICKKDGTSAFCDNWTEIWQQHCTDTLAEYDKQSITAFESGLVSNLPPRPVFLQADDNSYSPPASPDYYIVGEWLKKKFDTPQGEALMQPMWSSAMDYNGWRADDSKNSEKTDSSVPSGEKLTAGV